MPWRIDEAGIVSLVGTGDGSRLSANCSTGKWKNRNEPHLKAKSWENGIPMVSLALLAASTASSIKIGKAKAKENKGSRFNLIRQRTV